MNNAGCGTRAQSGTYIYMYNKAFNQARGGETHVFVLISKKIGVFYTPNSSWRVSRNGDR